ncbi:sulfotransferase family protein [Gracilimonas mengyeensis]|uniref:Sulfotransferase family protein n=1 Tax=Gracilimonas mengyeensis TaxID=1302730 RepID=A0A521AET5_9BACT|nr:sulfotransferase [Gracilimonas mengyeensis]SMO33311.1 Sulfotransferase family protein [Gracilimonas mengyeensis]
MAVLQKIGDQITALSDALGFERRDLKADLGLPWYYLKSRILNSHFKWDYEEIERYCMFIGYPRSGHTLVGSLLDAHPDVVISHELDALRYLRAGFSREQIFSLILHKDKVFTGKGREWTGYDYALEGLWQGRYRNLKVIGDKKGGGSSRHLQAKPDIIEKLRAEIKLPLKLIHIVRHPLDNIATHKRKWEGGRHSLQEAIDSYFERVEANAKLKTEVDAGEWCELTHEQFIEDSKGTLRTLVEFLEVEPYENYLNAAAEKVFDSPSKSRNKIEWPQEMIDQVAERSQKYEFLKDYEFTVG